MSQLLQNAVYGGAMILVVAVLRRVLKDRLVPEARLALWAVCLFRLLTPAAPESVLSLWGLGRWFEREAASVPAPGPVASVPHAEGMFVPETPAVTAPPAAPAEAGLPWDAILTAAWVVVGTALAVWFVRSYLRTRRAVGCAIPIGRDDPRYAPLPQFARLREGPMDGAPLTFGAARPTVVLTPGLNGEKLVCVLAHEGVHASRRDNVWHYVMTLALIVHWWNPAVWLMARLLRRDVELSCDRATVRKLGADRRAEYAKALVSMATVAEGPAFCQTFGRKAAEERVISIMKYKKTTVIGAALSLALVLGLTAGFASNPAEPGADGKGGSSFSTEAPEGMPWGAEKRDYSIEWSRLEESLADWVTNGELAREKADEILAWAREATEDEEGERFYWTFDEDCGMVTEDGSTFYQYRDKNGELAKIDSETFVRVFISPMVGETPVTVEVELGEKAPVDTTQQGTPDEYEAQRSTSLFFDNGKLTQLTITMDALAKDLSAQVSNRTLTQAKADQVMAQAMTIAKDGVLDWVFQGDSGLVRESTGKNSEAICYRDGDGNLVPVSLSEIVSLFILPVACPPEAVDQNISYGACGVAGCTEARNHAHTNGCTVLVYEPCPVEGCTITGFHDHDGAAYSCNGAGHGNGVCDGSCYVYSTPIYYAVNGTDATQSTGGHHSEGHHGNGHH